MDSGQMHRLGKRLIELSAVVTGATGDSKLTLGEAAVLEEVVEHPGIPINRIHERTGFSQSHVSASVVQLKERGLVQTVGQPPDKGSAWRSHTRVRATGYALKTISHRQSRPVDEAVIRAAADPSQARRAIPLLDELADILL
jgi:DNA-binding MarR family transcriptional regulator